MPGPLPKPAGQRRRRNVAVPRETNLHALAAPTVPELPFAVSAATSSWWSDIWSSEMAGEWLPSDLHGLVLVARLVEDYWTAPDANVRAKLATEIRLQRQCYGLTPIDRRRLQWNTDRPAEPNPTVPSKSARARKAGDPRLKEV